MDQPAPTPPPPAGRAPVAPLTSRERMRRALAFEQPDRPPHFETMFELEHEAFGLRFPDRREWAGCTAARKREMIARCVEIYQRIVATFGWDALAVFWPWSDPDGVAAARADLGDQVLIGSIVGGSVWAIEQVSDWMAFATALAEHPASLHEQARHMDAAARARIRHLADAGAEFILLVNDVAGNRGTFIAPDKMRDLVLPYLAGQVAHIRDCGCIPFIHTDGNIMAILDDWIALGAACYQSIDPQAGMDIAVVKARCHGRLALMGNVQCSLLQDGPPAAIAAAARYCLTHASPGGGYIFGTSNTIFPGMPLANYHTMLSVYREYCRQHPGGG